MSQSDTANAKKYSSIAEVAAAQCKAYTEEARKAPDYATDAEKYANEALNSASDASNSASEAFQYSTAASQNASSAQASADSSAQSATDASTAVSKTLRVGDSTLSVIADAELRANKIVSFDSTGDVTLTDPGIPADLKVIDGGSDFSTGATLTDPRHFIYYVEDALWYYWSGTFPKVVAPDSSPGSTGGVSPGNWAVAGSVSSPSVTYLPSLSEAVDAYFTKGSVVIIGGGRKYVASYEKPRNSRIPILQTKNGYLVPLNVDDGSQFLSCNKIQTASNYQESGSLHAQGIEYDNQNSRVFITSYRTSGSNQLTVIREYNLNNDGTIGSLVASCENLPFGHSEYLMFENAEDGNTYIWGHQGPTFAANAVIRLQWTGSTTGSNTPTVSIPVTMYGAEKPFISWYGYEDSMIITFPDKMLGCVCRLDDLIQGNLSPYKTIDMGQYTDILAPRIGQMVKHHGRHHVSLSGYYMNAALGTRTASTYETNALAGSVPDGGQGYNLNLVDTSVSALNEIQSMGFFWDSSSEKYNSIAMSVDGDYNLYLYALTDIDSVSSRDKTIKPWNVMPSDAALPSLAPGRAVLSTPYVADVAALSIGSTQSGSDGSVINSSALGDWTATQTLNNANRQEATERFYQYFRNAWYGPNDTVRYMGHTMWDDRTAASQGPLGSTVGSATAAGWSIGHNPARAQFALNSYKYALNVQPQSSADYGGIKSSASGTTGRPCFMAGGNQRYAADGTVYLGLYAEATGAWNPLITGTSATVKFNAPPAPIADNSLSNGTAALRWSQVYAATATINTSDETAKMDIVVISDEVLDAWSAVEYQQFRYKDAVQEKGEDKARFHFGVIAQRVKAAFEEADLDPFCYGVLCYDEWQDVYEEVKEYKTVKDDEGQTYEVEVLTGDKRLVQEAGSRYGIRYEEALILEAALMRRATKRLEDRIAVIESK